MGAGVCDERALCVSAKSDGGVINEKRHWTATNDLFYVETK